MDLATVQKAIEAAKNHRGNITGIHHPEDDQHTPIVFRPEQKEAIQATVKRFKKHDNMLWHAKMRFGKTVCALQVIQECKFKKTIIITHRPVVDKSWYDDFKNIFYYNTDYIYGSKGAGNSFDQLIQSNRPFVYFASIQDLRGSQFVGGKHEKNDVIFETVFDCVIVDEAHEGTRTVLGEDTVQAILKWDQSNNNNNHTKLLALSGTPFNIVEDFDADAIYTWDYVMEQGAKNTWDRLHPDQPNPYAELPKMKIYTYDLGKLLHDSRLMGEDKAFKFSEFFRTWTTDIQLDNAPMPEGAQEGDFVYEPSVQSFLNLLTQKNSAYPYSTEQYRSYFKHALWMVPGVKEARALQSLLEKHPVFKYFHIVNVAGSNGEESNNALDSVHKAIRENDYTITLSCGKLTTGVTVPEWTCVLMLSGGLNTSASAYMQTIFRVQSPCTQDGWIKDTVYVFDFSPDRTLKVITEAVTKSNAKEVGNSADKKKIKGFLNFCPVIAISGSRMTEYSPSRLFQELKKVYAERIVTKGFDDTSLYNSELLMNLGNVDWEDFKKLKQVVGETPAADLKKDIEINSQGLTEKQKAQFDELNQKPKKLRTPEEQEAWERFRKLQQDKYKCISILRAISIRMPLLIYGADVPSDQDIGLKEFIRQVDDDSWKEFMPKGVTKQLFEKFIKYYDENIFIAAGHRIRSLAKAADDMSPTLRVQSIAQLFSYFKNPDKETVLTPWRVVNLHLSKTLGGYDFFDEAHATELDMPRFVDQGQTTARTLGDTNARILEINSKTGLYPLYVAYSIYRAMRKQFYGGKDKAETDKTRKKDWELWNATLNRNVFVVCKTPMAQAITKRTLGGYQKDVSIHTLYYKHDLIQTIRTEPKKFIQFVQNTNKWFPKVYDQASFGLGKKMKFDAVVGNPPYQEATKDTSDKPVYHLFMNAGFELSTKTTFITPARFLFNAGKTPKEWNKQILNDEHFKVIYYTPNSLNVFPNVDIKKRGGVTITLMDNKATFAPVGFFSHFAELKSIYDKVKPTMKSGSLADLVILQEKFNLDVVYEQYPELKKKIGSNGNEQRLTTSIFTLTELFSQKEKQGCVKILGLVKNNREYRYIERKFIEPHVNLDKYKVIIPKANGTGAIGEVLSTPLSGNPLSGLHSLLLVLANLKQNLKQMLLINIFARNSLEPCWEH